MTPLRHRASRWVALALTFLACVLGVTVASPASAATYVNASVYGAKGDGVTDDTAALQRGLNALTSGQQLMTDVGKTYAHSGVLRITKAGTGLAGEGTLLATNELNSMFRVEADNVTIDGPRFLGKNTTKRYSAFEQMGVVVYLHTGFVMRNVTIDNMASAGLMLHGASNYLIDHVAIKNTRSDCLHQTHGANFGTVNNVTVTNCGDDGFAVVSYRHDGATNKVHDITYNNPVFNGQVWGRGFSVVGGYNVTYNNPQGTSSDAAMFYFAAEGGSSFDTYAPQNVEVNGGKIVNSNKNTGIGHGAVMIYNAQPTERITNINIHDLEINNTRTSAPRVIGLSTGNGSGGADHIALTNIAVTGTHPSTIIYNNGTAASYNSTNVTVAGVRQADHKGW
jgi:hypothetical protein